MTHSVTADINAPLRKHSHEKRTARQTSASARFFLRLLFWLARRAPWTLRWLKPLGVWGALHCSAAVRRGVHSNARRLLGSHASEEQCSTFARAVVGQFYDFVVDVGQSSAMTIVELRQRIESIEGREAYVDFRKRGGGAIILTAHMGSFEVALASLAEVEPDIHVVFKRDALDGFETIRRDLRKNLGIHEAAIDEGWATWIRLRNALEQNHVVVMQADRAMPGQKSQAVPILGGSLALPLGPVTLAQITGSPIIPVFAIRTPTGRCRLIAEAPILVYPDAELIDGIPPALLQIGKTIEKYLVAYPEQWLVLEAAFVEDASA